MGILAEGEKFTLLVGEDSTQIVIQVRFNNDQRLTLRFSPEQAAQIGGEIVKRSERLICGNSDSHASE